MPLESSIKKRFKTEYIIRIIILFYFIIVTYLKATKQVKILLKYKRVYSVCSDPLQRADVLIQVSGYSRPDLQGEARKINVHPILGERSKKLKKTELI